MPTEALHHLVINLDVQDSGRRRNSGQLKLRDIVHTAVRSAFTATGIELTLPLEDRGDGLLLVLPAGVPKQSILGRWVEELHQALRVHNFELREPVRVRLGMHAGEVHFDAHGIAGTDVNIACRLANCEVAKNTLRAAPPATMVLAISDFLYQSVVCHGGPFIDEESYRRHSWQSGEYTGSIWIYVPGYATPPEPDSAPPAAREHPKLPPTSSPQASIGHDISVRHNKIKNFTIGGTINDRSE